MPAKTALIYSSEFGRYSYGVDHPFKVQRYLLAYELIRSYGLHDSVGSLVSAYRAVSDEELLSFHRADYLTRLREFSEADQPRADFRYGLGDVENPVFKGFYDWACLGTAGTVEAARLVAEEGCDIAFNLAGGWHHAHRARASGFSYLNDAVIAINNLVAKG